jgi:hypothetical protein
MRRPVDWKELKKVCELEGCRFQRQKGDHYIMTKAGIARPIVFPRKKGLKEDIVLSVGRTLGLDRKAILARLEETKGK